MPEAFLPNARDKQLLQWMLSEIRSKVRSGFDELGDFRPSQASASYVAKVPDAGIPALTVGTPDVPGMAECQIYKVVTDSSSYTLVDAGFAEIVFNLAQSVIETRYVSITKDRFGTWIVDTLGVPDIVGTGTAPCDQLAGISLGDLEEELEPDYALTTKDNCLKKTPVVEC